MSLTHTAQVTRRAVAATIVVLFLLMGGQLFWKVGYAIYQYFFPPQTPPPEAAFGKIPQAGIESLQTKYQNWNIVIDTPTGKLPQMEDRLPVFPLDTPVGTPFAQQKAKETARMLGFPSSPQVVSPSRFRWKTKTRQLEMNVVSQAFTLETDLNYLEALLNEGSAPYKNSAEKSAVNFLRRIDLENEKLEEAEKTTTYIKVKNAALEKAESLSEAHLTRVDFHKIISGKGKTYRVVGPQPRQGLTYMLIAGKQLTDQDQFPIANYQNWIIKTDEGSEYPLLAPKDAWKRLTEGKAYLVYLKKQQAGPYFNEVPQKVTKVRIQNIKLAYYESKDPQKYLTPIYFFEGLAEVTTGNPWEVIFYLPAVTDDWIKGAGG